MTETPKIIAAEEFVLVDSEGQPRANWAVDDGGDTKINFLDRNGNPRTEIGVGKDGIAAIRMWDGHRNPKLFITVTQAGDTIIACLDTNGNNRFQLRISNDGTETQLGLGTNPAKVLLSAVDGQEGVVCAVDQSGRVKSL